MKRSRFTEGQIIKVLQEVQAGEKGAFLKSLEQSKQLAEGA